MTCSRAAVAVALLGAISLSCGQGVHDLSVSADPLLVIRGHVDPAKLQRVHPEAPLLGLLVWASAPHINVLCLAYPDVADLQAACPDPYGVYYGEIQKAVPVAADGSFEIDLANLPNARVSIGDTVTRIAYGALLVAEDTNGDGQLSLPRGGGGFIDGGANGAAAPDVVVGASFYSLRNAQERIVFRESGFVEGSNFYPAPGCPTPPRGFSVLAAPAYSDAGALPGTCTEQGFDQPVDVAALTSEQALSLACRTVQQGFGVREATDERNPNRPGRDGASAKQVCLSHEILALVSPGLCPTFNALALKGCRQDPFCLTPDWDHTAHPPSWWPCP
jgi:hypothetical protein